MTPSWRALLTWLTPGRDKARCLAVRFLIPLVWNRTCDFHRIRLDTLRSVLVCALCPLVLHDRAGCRGLRIGVQGPFRLFDSVSFAFHRHPQVHSPMFASITFAPEDSQGLGPSPLGFFCSSRPMWAAFPQPLTRSCIPAASDYYAPSDSFKVIGISCGLPLSYSPLPFAFLAGLPCPRQRTSLWMALRWRVHLRVPSPLWGSPSST